VVHVSALPDHGLRVETGAIETTLVPSPVAYQVVLPPGYGTEGYDTEGYDTESYNTGGASYPLLACLHGGVGGHDLLRQMAPVLDEMWAAGTLPPLVAVAPETGHSFFLDYRDGSQRWETFLVEAMLSHIRQRYRVCRDRDATWVCGMSMGGMGALRLGLKHPDLFRGVVAWEPSIEPALAWQDVKLEDRFWRTDETFETRFGRPLDPEYWAANNPATIAATHAARLRASGIALYLEVGTDDAYGLYRGAEFLHRVLYDQGIRHGYRCVWAADHTGPTLPSRLRDGLAFAAGVLRPAEPDPRVEQFRALVALQKGHAGLVA
jgi:S-formylglutathione hydrolase